MAKSEGYKARYKARGSGRNRAAVSVSYTVNDQKKAQAVAERLGTTLQGLADISGAAPGTTVSIEAHQSLISDSVHAVLKFSDSNIEGAIITVVPDSTGKLHTRVEEVYTRKNAAAGSGSEVVARVEAASKRAGISKVSLHAVSDAVSEGERKGEKSGGYYAWAKRGYDGKVPTTKAFKAALANSPYAGSKRVQQIVKADGGLAWWKQNGSGFEGEKSL